MIFRAHETTDTMKTFVVRLAVLVLMLSARIAFGAAIVKVTMDSGSRTLLDKVGAGAQAITGGTTSDGDGAVLQLGYYTAATAGFNFAGTWIGITGKGGANSAFNTVSIGDRNADGAGDGTFAFTLLVFDTLSTTSNVVPPVGAIVAFRIYNAKTIATSTFFMSLSDDSWIWPPAGNPGDMTNTLTISLDDPSLRVQNSSGTGSTLAPAGNIGANIPVPEPSSQMLLLGGAIGLLLCRRKR